MADSEDVEVEEEDGHVSRKPCEGSKRELIKCLKESECIKVGDSIPVVCQIIYYVLPQYHKPHTHWHTPITILLHWEV